MKKNGFWLSYIRILFKKIYIYYFWNLHERSAIGWLKRKTKLKNSPFSIFNSLSKKVSHFSVIFVTSSPQFSSKFRHNSKNKNRRICLLFYSFYSAHSPSFVKFPPLLREEGGSDFLVHQIFSATFSSWDMSILCMGDFVSWRG